jgi:arsenite methyltransferase
MARDLMFQQEIKETVQRAYAAITGGAGETVARRHYSDRELAEVPAGAVAWALGVGNPVRYAWLQPGQAVLDVGSGGGIDTILAARGVGPEGRAIGLDVLEEMCERGRGHAAQAGVEGWTEFRQGEMEDIPLPDASVDVAISNGVLNLSARKSRALAEIYRVLRPEGRMCMADLTVEGELPRRWQAIRAPGLGECRGRWRSVSSPANSRGQGSPTSGSEATSRSGSTRPPCTRCSPPRSSRSCGRPSPPPAKTTWPPG